MYLKASDDLCRQPSDVASIRQDKAKESKTILDAIKSTLCQTNFQWHITLSEQIDEAL